MDATDRDCPVCEFPIPVPYDAEAVVCPDCHTVLQLDYDYSFDEGQWRDCTTMRPMRG